MKAFVLATMPAYKEEDLDQFTFTQLAAKVALAEQIIKVNQAAFGGADNDLHLDLIDPEEEAAKEAAEEAERKKRQKRAWDLLGKSGVMPDDPSGEKAPPIAPKVRSDDPIAQKLFNALQE